MIAFWIFASIVLLFGFVVFRGAPYVPSHHKEAARALDELYTVSAKDVVLDVGSGDGIILRLASRRGAQAVGYELNPALVLISRFLSRGDKKVRVVLSDFWLTAFPEETTLVYGFCVSRDMAKMARKLQHEANRLRRTLYYVGYGSELKGYAAKDSLGAHHLYEFVPLQEVRA
jgi:SAM-dependent methyltransferase